jgi:hypothetical protein
MQNSASYILLEEMLLHRQIQMELLEFEKLVDFLKHRELITSQEQQALLDLARNTIPNN